MLNVIFYALYVYFVYQENLHIYNSYSLYLLNMNLAFWKNVVLKMLIKWDL